MGKEKNLSIVKWGFIASFTQISLKKRLILWEVSRVKGKQVSNVNDTFLEETDFRAVTRTTIRKPVEQ